MNNSKQALNGFKTFLLTLAVSLVVFGAVYYITSYPSYNLDIESASKVLSAEDESSNHDSATEESAFAGLNKTKVSTPKKVVLSGTTVSTTPVAGTTTQPAGTTTQTHSYPTVTETSQSSVPSTGISSVTVFFTLSSVLLLCGIFYLYLGPRRIALQSFEEKILK